MAKVHPQTRLHTRQIPDIIQQLTKTDTVYIETVNIKNRSCGNVGPVLPAAFILTSEVNSVGETQFIIKMSQGEDNILHNTRCQFIDSKGTLLGKVEHTSSSCFRNDVTVYSVGGLKLGSCQERYPCCFKSKNIYNAQGNVEYKIVQKGLTIQVIGVKDNDMTAKLTSYNHGACKLTFDKHLADWRKMLLLTLTAACNIGGYIPQPNCLCSRNILLGLVLSFVIVGTVVTIQLSYLVFPYL